jgi:G:T-mismatch repair DNA endonuclease (very short patch repair protein)
MKIICPECKKILSKVPHFSSCNPNNLSKEVIKQQVFEYNFKDFIQQNQDTIKYLYNEKEFSVQELSKRFGISWGKMKLVLSYLGITTRNLSQASSTTRTRNKYQETCQSIYGATNALSKDTSSYHKRNKTIKSKYGVSNVRQLDSVKKTINETMLARYGVLRISKLPKFSKKDPNKLESRISSCLTDLQIGHKYSHYVARRQFDFLINGTKILLEVNGDFWHANPSIYQPDHILKFIKGYLTAQDIWNRDKQKIDLAKKHHYHTIILWESEIRSKSDEELKDWLINLLAEALHLLPPSQQ